MIIQEVLEQRLLGIKNEAGVYITPAFPKLVYVLDEHNCLKGGKYDYLTELAVRCSAKRMYPDYISAKKMRENYQGNVFSPMGCVSGVEIVTYRMDGVVHVESFTRMWNTLKQKFGTKRQNPDDDTDFYLYIDTPGVEIYDQTRGFVKNYRIIRNVSDKWNVVSFDDGRRILCTTDHPFETENRGVVHAEDLVAGDTILALPTSQAKHGILRDFGPAESVEIHVASVDKFEDRVAMSYDVTTESEHFTVSGIYSHNCRSFLAPWRDESGKYRFEGRFNQG